MTRLLLAFAPSPSPSPTVPVHFTDTPGGHLLVAIVIGLVVVLFVSVMLDTLGGRN